MAGLQGRIFGGYELTTPLGSGGICDVYRAKAASRPGGREVVVKVIPPEFARQPGFLPRFRQVAQLAGRLASHPHILPLLGSGEEAGSPYLVSPYVADGTLKDWIARGGRIGISDAGPFFHQLCDALAYAHSLGVVHGDVKPSNIYLFEGRHVLLGDFGLLLDLAHMDMTHADPGTEAVAFLAPEVASGQPSQASDMYGVGAVLFAAITGQPPFRAGTPGEMFAAHGRQPVPHLQQVAPGLPPAIQALDPIIQRAMAKRVEERFPSAAALAHAIETAIQQAPQPSAGVGAIPGAPPRPAGPANGFAPLGAAGGPLAPPAFGAAPLIPFSPPHIGAALPSAGLGPGGGLQALNFPPLKGEVDGDMDQGRIIVSPKAPPTAPTLRMPGGAPGVMAPVPGSLAPEPPTVRMPAPAPAPFPGGTAGPGISPQFTPAMIPPPGGAGNLPFGTAAPPPGFDGGERAPQAMPAIRIPPPQQDGHWQTGQQRALSPVAEVAPLLADDMRDRQDEGYTGNYSAPLDSVEIERPFSPTELGLPRLTSPDLRELPASWQDLVRDAPRQQRGEYGGSYRSEQEALAQWSAELPEGAGADWGYPPDSAEGASSWAGGGDARSRHPRRWLRRVAIVILLLVVVNVGALVVTRPDLCPISACQSLSDKAHQYLPFLAQPSPTPPAVSGAPATVSITVASGKSATAALSFKDVSSGAVTWSASVGLSWASVSPSRGSLQPGESENLTLTADASKIGAGKYPTMLTISSGGQVMRVPVTITVKAGS